MSIFKKEFEDEKLRLFYNDENIRELLNTDSPEIGINLLYARDHTNDLTANAIENLYKDRRVFYDCLIKKKILSNS